MSPLVITLLIVGGIVTLIAIAYINNLVENSKLEKARLKADLADRVRRLAEASERLPGQFMTPALKLMLSNLQVHFIERLLLLDRGNTAIKRQLDDLRQQIALGDSIPVRNSPQKIIAEAGAKDVRFQLENLHNLITRCAKDGVLAANDAKRWVLEIRHMLVMLHIELFTNIGTQALQSNQPGPARLAFERGVQYLRKQPDPTRYQAPLQKLEAQLARANAMVVDMGKPATDDNSELIDGLKALDSDDDWKKKSLYD